MSEPTAEYLDRSFHVTGDGTCIEVRVSHGVSAAYDLLTDAGYSPQKAAEIATGAERMGKDPEQFARHFLRLAAAARGQ